MGSRPQATAGNKQATPTIVFAVGIWYVLMSERTTANERRIMGDGIQAQVKPNIFPGLRYQDAPAAMVWLAEAFGFGEHFVVPGQDETIAHAQMRFGSGLIMLGSMPAVPDPDNPWDAVRYGIYVCVEDIDAHYERARAAGANIVRKLIDTEYGSREYSAQDPEGNLWSFGTYDPLAV